MEIKTDNQGRRFFYNFDRIEDSYMYNLFTNTIDEVPLLAVAVVDGQAEAVKVSKSLWYRFDNGELGTLQILFPAYPVINGWKYNFGRLCCPD